MIRELRINYSVLVLTGPTESSEHTGQTSKLGRKGRLRGAGAREPKAEGTRRAGAERRVPRPTRALRAGTVWLACRRLRRGPGVRGGPLATDAREQRRIRASRDLAARRHVRAREPFAGTTARTRIPPRPRAARRRRHRRPSRACRTNSLVALLTSLDLAGRASSP